MLVTLSLVCGFFVPYDMQMAVSIVFNLGVGGLAKWLYWRKVNNYLHFGADICGGNVETLKMWLVNQKDTNIVGLVAALAVVGVLFSILMSAGQVPY